MKVENKIPKTINEITAEYLTEIFSKNEYLVKGVIESFIHEEDKIGVNSSSGHFKLNYSDGSEGDKPEKIFIKLNQKNIGKNETNIYKFLKEKNVDLDIFVECYYVDYDQESQNAIIILKDYKELHTPPIDLAAFVPRKNVPDDEAYHNMIEATAKLHAYFWEDKSLFDEKYKLETEDWSINSDKEHCEKLWKDFYEKEKHWIPEATKIMFEDAIENYTKVWEKYYVPKIRENRHFTLINSDCYFQQFLCLKEESEVKVKMIDLGLCVYSPAYDLPYLFIKKLTPAQRNFNNREQRFLKYYHECLVKFGVENYSFEQLILDYKVEVFFLIFFALWDYSYQGSDDPYWWFKFQNVNHAFIDLKCSELYK